MTIDHFFHDRVDSRRLFDVISNEIEHLGDAEIRVSKSQIAFRRKKNFALVWIPGHYLKNCPTPPLVLTLSFPERDASPRWKEITEINPNRFTHHLELYGEEEIDEEVRSWLRIAWDEAA